MILCIGYLGDMIQAQVGDVEHLVEVSYSQDGPKLLERVAPSSMPAFIADHFFILYGDSLGCP